jgi:hypothetical protein
MSKQARKTARVSIGADDKSGCAPALLQSQAGAARVALCDAQNHPTLTARTGTGQGQFHARGLQRRAHNRFREGKSELKGNLWTAKLDREGELSGPRVVGGDAVK